MLVTSDQRKWPSGRVVEVPESLSKTLFAPGADPLPPGVVSYMPRHGTVPPAYYAANDSVASAMASIVASAAASVAQDSESSPPFLDREATRPPRGPEKAVATYAEAPESGRGPVYVDARFVVTGVSGDVVAGLPSLVVPDAVSVPLR